MKNKILLLLSLVIFLLPLNRANAAEQKDAVNKIIEYEMEQAATTSLQGLVDNGLVPYAGISPTEWIIGILARTNPELDFTEYINATNEYIEKHAMKMTATDYERIAFAYLTLNVNKEWIERVIDEQTGKRGIMSIIYGLMLATHGDFNTTLSKCEIVDELLEFQLEDGGFAVSGTRGDIDVTAMVLQAMAPMYDMYKAEIEKALRFLTNNQLENGGFASFGIENVESASQVLMAYCELGIEDAANYLVDYILKYQNADGGFSHLPNDKSNGIATYQAWQALSLYNSTFYDIKIAEDTNVAKTEKLSGKDIKKIIFISIGGIFLFIVLAFIFTKKMKKKKIIIITIIAMALEVFIFFAKIETTEEHRNNVPTGDWSTTIEIIGYNNVILDEQEIKIKENDSAFSQLNYALSKNGIVMDYTGTVIFSNVYIKSIDGLSEFDYGKMSGWTYTVNGEYPNVGCSQYKLSAGDKVVWIYKEGD